MIKAIFFDLFFTLVYPCYLDENEYNVIGISSAEWEKYAENRMLYNERAKGKIKTEREIIDKIVNSMPDILDVYKRQMKETANWSRWRSPISMCRRNLPVRLSRSLSLIHLFRAFWTLLPVQKICR